MSTSANGLTLSAQMPPLRVDDGGAVRVGGTRITLDLIVSQYDSGMTPEDMVRAYDTLKIEDVYAVLAYYHQNRTAVRQYMDQRKHEAATLRAEVEGQRPRISRDDLMKRSQGRQDASPGR